MVPSISKEAILGRHSVVRRLVVDEMMVANGFQIALRCTNILKKTVHTDHLHMEDRWNHHRKGYKCDVRNEVTLEPTPLDTCRRGRCHRHYPGTNRDPGPLSPEAHSCHIAHHFAAAGYGLCENWYVSHVMIVCSFISDHCIVEHVGT